MPADASADRPRPSRRTSSKLRSRIENAPPVQNSPEAVLRESPVNASHVDLGNPVPNFCVDNFPGLKNSHQGLSSDSNVSACRLAISLPPPFATLDSRCEICFDPVDRTSSDNVRICTSCFAVACRNCFVRWLEAKILSGQAQHLQCVACPQEISDAEVFDMCGERTFRKLGYFISKSEHRTNPNALWCPADGCWQLIHGQSYPPPSDLATAVCQRCSIAVCVHCHEPAHPSRSCTTPKVELLQTARARLWTRVHAKACPRCTAPIQRSGGCKHMRCSSCGAYFCWVCKGNIRESVSAPSIGRACVCNRVHDALFWVSFTGGLIIGLPVLGAAVVVAAPPALVWYAFSVKEKRRQLKDHIYSVLGSF